MSAPKIEMFVTLGCPYCQKALAWMEQYKMNPTVTVFRDYASKQKFYSEHPGVRTVPQIFVDGKRIGGWTDLLQSEFRKQVEATNEGS